MSKIERSPCKWWMPHEWSKWEDVATYSIHGSVRGLILKSTCLKCGLIKTKRIGI